MYFNVHQKKETERKVLEKDSEKMEGSLEKTADWSSEIQKHLAASLTFYWLTERGELTSNIPVCVCVIVHMHAPGRLDLCGYQSVLHNLQREPEWIHTLNCEFFLWQ